MSKIYKEAYHAFNIGRGLFEAIPQSVENHSCAYCAFVHSKVCGKYACKKRTGKIIRTYHLQSYNKINMSKIKNFKDLVFIPHPIAGEAQKLPLYLAKEYAEAKQAKMNFENGYGISVIFGSMFYSNGIDTYEVGILKDGILCYATPITDDVIGYITADEVTDIMRKIQELPID